MREAIDREFHLRIAKATGNGSLELVVEGLWNQRAELWGRMQQHFHTARSGAQDDSRSCGDPGGDRRARSDAARAAMHRHLARVVREFQRGVDGSRARHAAQQAERGREPRQAAATDDGVMQTRGRSDA